MIKRYKNPLVRGYDIAISYSKSQVDYAKEIYRLLKEKDVDVFLYDAPEFSVGLSGGKVAANLESIFLDSTIIIAIIGGDYEERTWPSFESSIIKHRFGELGDYVNILILDAEDKKLDEMKEKWRVNGFTLTSDITKDLIVDELQNRICDVNKQEEEAAKQEGAAKQESTDVFDAQMLQLVERHFPIAKQYWADGLVCPVNGNDVAHDCMGALMAIPLAATIGTKQKYIRLGRIIRILHEIERIGITTDLNLLHSVSIRLLAEFQYLDAIKDVKPEGEGELKERARLSNLVRCLQGFLEHHTFDRYPAQKFLDSLSLFASRKKASAEAEADLLRKSAQFCIEAGNIADKIWESEGLPGQDQVKTWSNAFIEEQKVGGDKVDYVKRLKNRVVAYNKFIIDEARLCRVRRYNNV